MSTSIIRSGNPTCALVKLCDELYDSGMISLPLYWIERPVTWIVNIKEDGEVRSIDPVYSGVKDVYVLPELLTGRSSGLSPWLCHDTGKYFMTSTGWKSWREKHLEFAKQIGFPECFVKFLEKSETPFVENNDLWNKMFAQLESCPIKGKDTEKALISGTFVFRLPDGTMLQDIDGVKMFWTDVNILNWQNSGREDSEKDLSKKGYSSITGKYGDMTPFHAVIGSCIPGAQSGAKIGSINSNASCYYSYGLEGAFCSPMTIEETFKLKSAVQYLAKNKKDGYCMVSGSKRKFVIWRNSMVDDKTLVVVWGPKQAVDPLDFDNQDYSGGSEKANLMISLLRGDVNELPELTQGDNVHCMTFSAKSGGRIVIDDYWYEDAPGFATRLAKWYKNTMLYNDDGNPTYAGLWNCINALNFPKGKMEKTSEKSRHAYRLLQSSIFNGNALPSEFVPRARQQMEAVLSKPKTSFYWFDGYSSPFRMFMACRKASGVQYKEGSFEMIHKNWAYKLGVLLIKMDDAKQMFDMKRGRKGLGMELTPTAKELIRSCKSNPNIGLRGIREKLMVFNSNVLAETSDVSFEGMKSFMNPDDMNEFWAGIADGLAQRRDRFRVSKAKKEMEKK